MFHVAPNVSADEAGLVFGAVVQPPPNERVQNIYYSGDTLSLTMPDSRFIGKAKSGDADRYLTVQSGQLLVNQQPAAGTTNHYFKVVGPAKITDTTSVLKQGSAIALSFAGNGAGERAFLTVDTDGSVKTEADVTSATKFKVTDCSTACLGPNWRHSSGKSEMLAFAQAPAPLPAPASAIAPASA